MASWILVSFRYLRREPKFQSFSSFLPFSGCLMASAVVEIPTGIAKGYFTQTFRCCSGEWGHVDNIKQIVPGPVIGRCGAKDHSGELYTVGKTGRDVASLQSRY
jgi:hypothetical protein